MQQFVQKITQVISISFDWDSTTDSEPKPSQIIARKLTKPKHWSKYIPDSIDDNKIVEMDKECIAKNNPILIWPHLDLPPSQVIQPSKNAMTLIDKVYEIVWTPTLFPAIILQGSVSTSLIYLLCFYSFNRAIHLVMDASRVQAKIQCAVDAECIEGVRRDLLWSRCPMHQGYKEGLTLQ